MSSVIAEWPIIDCLRLFYVFHVADNSSITTESIPKSLLVEPCTLCDDESTFDYKATSNATNHDDKKEDYGDSVLDDTVMKY